MSRTQLGKLLVLSQAIFLQFFKIIDFRNRHDTETAKMGVHDDWLCIRITDNTDTNVSFEFPQIITEFRSEIRVLYIMNRAMEYIVFDGYHTATLGAEMGMVVYTIK